MQSVLTVTLPVYNAMPYLTKAVESILAQTYEDFEFIVIDDGSTDESLKYLNSIEDSRLKVISQSNVGLGETLNRLVGLASGKYIARMDADDICLPDRFLKQVEHMEANPDISMLGSGVSFLYENCTWNGGPPLLNHDAIVSRFKRKKFGVCHPSIMFRTESFNKIGGYKVKGAGEDLDFFLRMSEVGRVANTPEVLLLYRMGSKTSLTSMHRDKLHLGYSYAIECAKMREQKRSEPEFYFFLKKWEARSIRVKVAEYFDDISEYVYRKGIVSATKKNHIRAYALFVLAAVSRPQTVVERIKLKLNYRNYTM